MADIAADGTHEHANSNVGTPPDPQSRRRPFFPDWPGVREHFQGSWLNMIVFLVLGVTALVLFLKPPPSIRPLYFRGLDPALAYPKGEEIITTYVSAAISTAGPPIIMIAVSVGSIRSYRALIAATRGLNMALLSTTLITVILKTTIGGLRPHFFAACKPRVTLIEHTWYTDGICGGPHKGVREAEMSFPSGHASSAFAAGVYLTLWLNAVLKIVGPYQSPHWKLVVLYAPIVCATLLGMSKVLDGYHHPSDVFWGGLIGTLFAIIAYRCVFLSVWDWRTNHIPLSLTARFGRDITGLESSRQFATRKQILTEEV